MNHDPLLVLQHLEAKFSGDQDVTVMLRDVYGYNRADMSHFSNDRARDIFDKAVQDAICLPGYFADDPDLLARSYDVMRQVNESYSVLASTLAWTGCDGSRMSHMDQIVRYNREAIEKPTTIQVFKSESESDFEFVFTFLSNDRLCFFTFWRRHIAWG